VSLKVFPRHGLKWNVALKGEFETFICSQIWQQKNCKICLHHHNGYKLTEVPIEYDLI